MAEENNLCGNTYTSEYSETEPCEQTSTDCIIYTPGIPEFSLNDSPNLTTIIPALVSALSTLSTVQGNIKEGNFLKDYVVADLPTGTEGQLAYVTDADTISYRANVVGGGTDKALVFFDGTNWIYH